MAGQRQRDPLWQHAVDEFVAEKRRSGSSPATLQIYENRLLGGRISAWRAKEGIERVSQLTPAALREYELLLADARDHRGRPLSAATRHQHHRVVHTFVAWCREEGWLVPEGTLAIRGPKLPQRRPPTLSAADEAKVLAACRCERDHYLIEFMLRTGIRLAGVCSATLDDIIQGPAGAMVRVVEKGNKERVIPLDTATYRGTRRLRTYIDTVRPRNTRRRELFLTLRLEDGGSDYSPLTPRAVQTIFKRLSLATGVKLHPHLLRHTMASRAIAAGVDPLTLQRVLGHSTLSTTAIYVQHDESSLSRIWARRTD